MVNSYHIESGGRPGGNRLAAILGGPGRRGEGGAPDVRPQAPCNVTGRGATLRKAGRRPAEPGTRFSAGRPRRRSRP